jgi:2-dehydro-3-deoxyphosphooctonate aldolase (KDO 8-P synthase)
VIAGPCVIESEATTLEVARFLAGVARRLSLPLVFKASFDKANRSSIASFRGPGLTEGLRILAPSRPRPGCRC